VTRATYYRFERYRLSNRTMIDKYRYKRQDQITNKMLFKPMNARNAWIHGINTDNPISEGVEQSRIRILHFRAEKYGRSYPDEYKYYVSDDRPFSRFQSELLNRLQNGASKGVRLTPKNIIPITVYGIRK